MKIIALLGPTINGIWDLRTRRVSLLVAAIYAVMGLSCHLVMHTISWDLLYALVPGLICMALAVITREQVGFGDAWMMLAMGCNLTGEAMMLCTLLAVGLAGAVGLFCLVFLHKSGKYELPFVPILALSCGIVVLGGGL